MRSPTSLQRGLLLWPRPGQWEAFRSCSEEPVVHEHGTERTAVASSTRPLCPQCMFLLQSSCARSCRLKWHCVRSVHFSAEQVERFCRAVGRRGPFRKNIKEMILKCRAKRESSEENRREFLVNLWKREDFVNLPLRDKTKTNYKLYKLTLAVLYIKY